MKTIEKMNEQVLCDEEIADRILKGEKHLYEKLIRKFNLRLFRIGMSIINDENEVEDIMQTTYLNAFLHLSAFQNKSSFGTWLTRILINESLLYKSKKLKREKILTHNSPDEQYSNTPLKDLMNNELKTILEKAIANLPEKYRIVFVMREIEEMSTNETMEILNLGESNVKIRLNRAKEMLRNELSAYYKTTQVYEFNLIKCDRIANFVMNKIM